MALLITVAKKEAHMRRVRYGGMSSLDGFIAGPNGDADWILMDPEVDSAARFARYDMLLIGRNRNRFPEKL
jgi:hypothetical protein